jgi:ATP-dependent Zn protease
LFRNYFGKPGDKQTAEVLKRNGENVKTLLGKVFDSVKPSAKFTNPNFNSQPRIATLEEMENLSQKIKDKINQIDSYQSLDEDSLCDTTSSASSELATFAELVFHKANETNNPNLIEKIKRNLSILPKELTNRNQSLDEKTNKQVESPEDENNGDFFISLFLYFFIYFLFFIFLVFYFYFFVF